MKKSAPRKAAVKRKSAAHKSAGKKAADRAWDEDGRLIKRLEAELFRAEDRDESEEE